MLCVLLVVAAVDGMWACEQRFSAAPPATPPETGDASPPITLDALLRQSAGDAAVRAPDASHALIISSCASAGQECAAADADASANAMYRVVFGSGRGVVRSREQATTDVYRELRDRIDAGERLTVRPSPHGDAGPGPSWFGRSTTASTPSSDALAQSAMRLLDAVDATGELLVDVDHDSRSGCMLSVAQPAGDAGALQCLIQEPDRPHGRGGGGMRF